MKKFSAINLGRARCAARLKDGGIKEQERKDVQEEDRREREENGGLFVEFDAPSSTRDLMTRP